MNCTCIVLKKTSLVIQLLLPSHKYVLLEHFKLFLRHLTNNKINHRICSIINLQPTAPETLSTHDELIASYKKYASGFQSFIVSIDQGACVKRIGTSSS